MKLFVENNGSKYPIIIGEDTDETPTGYLDETSIIGIGQNNAIETIMDYNHIRDWVLVEMMKKDPDQATAFNLCSPLEQYYLCVFQLMPYSVRLLFMTDAEDKINWDKLVQLTEGSPFSMFVGRSRIYQDMRVCVSDFVRREVWFPNDYQANLTYAQAFLKDVHLYKEYYIAANDPELGLFLRSEGIHLNDGFNSKVYWLQELEDNLLNIYNSY